MNRNAAKFWLKEDWPKEIAYKYTDGGYGWGIPPEWKIVTYQEIHAKKRARQNLLLERKRRPDTRTVPAFIWVFKNIHGFPFGGWWIYVKTLKDDHALNFRCRMDHIILQIMGLIPLGMMPIKQNIDPWMETFASTYPHIGFKRKRFQGLLRCYVTTNYRNDIIKVELRPGGEVNSP